ncbi:retrotransposon protein, putative, ty1-copia subclass [Tanacetum coccineum]
MFVIEQPLPVATAADFEAQVLSQWNAIYDAYNEFACLILDSMTLELHRQFENSSPYDMIKELKAMFEKQVRVERFDLIQTFHACKQEEGGKIQKPKKKSLKAKGKGKTNGKGNDKQVYIPKPKNPKPYTKEHPTKDDTCHHCKEVGHWKRNCPIYLAEFYSGIYKEHPTKDDTCHHCKEVGHWKRKCPIYLAELLKKKKQVGSASSLDDESFDKCVSCLSGKMTRKSFLHRPERATDLLRIIIHTDVCGPLRHVSRKCASYFITFTDDYSRYGYVYLLKHKHEVFETFKVFKNEVENQLGKTIKALRSD